MQFLNIWMILSLAQDARDKPALASHFQALFHTHGLDPGRRRDLWRIGFCHCHGWLGQGDARFGDAPVKGFG
jgi:hypothetical protein